MLRSIIGFVVGYVGTIYACYFADALSQWMKGDLPFSDTFGSGLDRMLAYLSALIEDPRNLENLFTQAGDGMILIGIVLFVVLMVAGHTNAPAGSDDDEFDYMECKQEKSLGVNPWTGVPMADELVDMSGNYMTDSDPDD
ncbi:hypothetical protein TspCOW1_13100 [Thiohalobacter sp. COW1]|uniref:hypothetical protein n=1 Tax=Thiohalobacter sp. COW1 TaxID=2795687 RepID=UPI001916139B|nr:hypothetical protein [Thiohalobacter sp. COW1]BCO31207.1 hypothetical protein TspCOW1_13100 [Thiohalobacter sp. COW1]